MNVRQVAEVNKGTRQQLKIGSKVSAGVYSAFLFTTMSHESWVTTLQKGLGTYLYFGSFLGLTLVKTGLYFYDLIQSKNKNIGKVASFLKEFICAVILSVSVIGGIVGSIAISALTPWLFVINLIINSTYYLIASMQNLYQILHVQDAEVRAEYQQSFKNNLRTAALFAISTVTVSLFMIAQVFTYPLAIINACLNVIGAGMGVYALVNKRREERQKRENWAQMAGSKSNLDESKSQVDETHSNSSTYLLLNKTVDNYYVNTKRRLPILAEADPKKYLLKEIGEKIISLSIEINASNQGFFSETAKRTAKIRSLEKLEKIVKNQSSTIKDFYTLLKEPEFNRFFNNPFQSFKHNVGGTQKIFDEAENYFHALKY